MRRAGGRVVAVTGAGSGIGRAVALRLARDGVALALLGRTRERLDAVAEEVRAAGARALAVPADVTDRAGLRDAFAGLAHELGPPDALVANAGCVGSNGLDDDTCWDAVVRTNLDGTYFSIRAFQAVMAPGPRRGTWW